MKTQAEPLTPEQARDKYPIRFAQKRREAAIKALAASDWQCVYWSGNQFIVDSWTVTRFGAPLAMFGRDGKI